MDTLMTFEQATKILPKVLYAGLDTVGQHKTIGDLRFMAQHELDLEIEGDIKLTWAQRIAIRRFLERTR